MGERLFTVKGFLTFKASVRMDDGNVPTEDQVPAMRPSFFVFELTDKRASWQSMFRALNISTTGVTWKKVDQSAQVTQKVKGLPSGWKITYTLYPESRSLVIEKVKTAP